MTTIDRPLPRRDGLHAKFYNYCRRHELRFQRCSQCRTWRHLPREVCHVCTSSEYMWERSAGFGRLYSWTVTHSALHPGFADDVPYISAIVHLDEGVRMVADLTGVGPAGLAAGLRVVVWFDDVDQQTTMPRFRQLIEVSTHRGKVARAGHRRRRYRLCSIGRGRRRHHSDARRSGPTAERGALAAIDGQRWGSRLTSVLRSARRRPS